MTESPEPPLLGSWQPITEAHAAALDSIVAAARRGEHRRFAVTADGGCGKTWLLREAATRLSELHYVVLFITAPEHNPVHNPSDRLRREIKTCETLISKIVADIVRDPTLSEARAIAERIIEASTASREIRVSATITNSPGARIENAANVTLGDEPRRLDVMRHTVVSELTRLSTTRPLAMLVDDVQQLHTRPDDPELSRELTAEQWLRDVLEQLPALAVEACRPRPADDERGDHTTPLHLGQMNEAQTRTHVRDRLSRWTPDRAEEIGGLLHRSTGGYPVWIDTYCTMINKGAPRDESPERISAWLTGGADAVSVANILPRFRHFVDDYAAELVGRPVPLFDQLAVVRRITDPYGTDNTSMLTALFNIPRHEAGMLYDWLSNPAQCTFMTAFDDDEDAGVRLHDRIRELALRASQDSARYTSLHERAERYYRETLNFDSELDEDSAWAAWHRYENPLWQRNSRDWIYHAGHVSRHAFEGSKEMMIRLFLEAFWWWDWLVPSTFTSDLLADYRALLNTRVELRHDTAGRHDEWLRRLEEFHTNWVSDWDRRPGEHVERWRKADDALRALWRAYRLDTRPLPDAPTDLRRIQIMLCCFRGDVAWFGSVGDARSARAAARWFEVAGAACVSRDDRWIEVWARYYRANVLVEHYPEEAAQLAADLPELVDEVEDNELHANVARLFGDLAWRRGEYSRAFDCYARSVLHGYVYHVRQELDRRTPSAYTVALYDEVRTRTVRRLTEAERLGLAEVADAAVVRMRELFAPYWNRVGEAADNPQGFPRGPGQDDLNKLGTPFSDMVEWTIENFEDQLAAPLDAPLEHPDAPDR